MALKNSQSGKSQLFVPGCSAAKPTGSDDKQTISNSMMQAYIAMRGPDMGEINDPLFEWIQSHNDEMTRKAASQPHGTPEPADNPRDVTEMLGYMDKAIGSDNMGGDSPRAAIFELRRPTINHIAPPAVMNLVPHRRAYSATDHRIPAWGDDGDDEDDDEGAVPTGRLSPCTFLQWSQDCKRWVRKEIMDPKNVLAKAKRMRPTEPVPARDHYPYYLEDAKAQRDHFTGEEFSPLYQVPHSPSLIYTPPGVPSVSYAPTAFLAQYDRMAPLDAKKLRDHVYGKTEKSMPPTSTNDKFTDSEVNNVANRITRSEGCGIPGSEIYAFLKAQYKAISKEQAEDETLRKRISAQTKRIHELEIERDGLREHFIPLLKKKRSEYRADQEQRALQALQEQRDIRDSRIREHLGNHIREVQLILDRSYMQRSESKQKFKANQQRLAQLEQEIIEDCRIAGTSPQDIYDELNNLVPPPLGPTWSVAKGVSHSAESFCRALDDNTTYPTSAAAKEPRTQVGEEPRMGTVDSVSGRTLVNPTRDRPLASFSLDVGQTVRDHTISSRDHHSLSSANKTTFPSGHNPQGEYASGPYRASDYGRDRPIPFGSQPMPNPRMDTTVHNTIPGKTEESSSTQGNLREKDKGSSHIRGPNQRICFAPPPGKPDPIDRSFYD
ncbi:hypothetical protein GL218_00247 [Daldinia childiae]|uniref:uncharacterized protein n=1 Tax=Daldinia childiae TaxID=326645 RepID=UPI0014477FC4|nr:uncharacterized protein GL218_00247 [Daldinia childiae]KAF3070405.1 hypothetical protein GL218_00247 [Daldinia childiae]